MRSTRVTQVLLAALVITQIPNVVSFVENLNRYGSAKEALRACEEWAESAGTFTLKRTGFWTRYTQNPVRSCQKEGDRYIGYEVSLDGATNISDDPEQPRGFDADHVPEAMDTGKRWDFKRRRWSIVIPL